MHKVLLFSFFNSNNIGDKAIGSVLYDLLSERFEVSRCSNEGSFDIIGSYPDQRQGLVQRIVHKLDSLTGKRYMTPRYRAFLEEYKNAVKNVDAVVIGGGNIMMDYTDASASYLKYGDYVGAARREGKPCCALGVGIGPFKTEDQAKNAVAVLNGCSRVSFRDANSYDLFVRNGGDAGKASVSCDPVFLLKKRDSAVEKNVIAVNVLDPRWDGGIDRAKTADAYAELCRALAKGFPDKNIALFCTEKNDAAIMREVRGKLGDLPGVSTAEPQTLEELTGLYAGCGLMIGTRMHSMIIAYTQEVPVIGISWCKKTDDFLKMTDPSGVPFEITDFGERIDEMVARAKHPPQDKEIRRELIGRAETLIAGDIDKIIF